MTEQLIALKTLATTTHQGYSLVTTGLQNIGSATDKEARLHQTYIQSLSKVNPVFIKQNSSTTKAVNYDSSLLHPIHQPVAHK
jgi:hypothetical protein